MTVFTIGVYGFSAATFLAELRRAKVPRLLDVRQRRGVRGAEYAWANSRRLQAALADAGIAYEHRPELAPTTELRELQYAEDARQGVGKRSRRTLAREYVSRYTAEYPRSRRPRAGPRRAAGGAAVRGARSPRLSPVADHPAPGRRARRRGPPPASAPAASARRSGRRWHSR